MRNDPTLTCHCEAQRAVAIQSLTQRPEFVSLDCHASLAMTIMGMTALVFRLTVSGYPF
jgi:hypothetical protein